MSKKGGFLKLLTGIGVGIGVGLLVAPQSGEKTRKELKKKCNEFIADLKEVDYEEVKDNLIEKVQNLQKELSDLDKEKVLEIAKVKGEEIQEKAESLYKEAVKQGKPIIEKTADDIRKKTIIVMKDIIKKLEETEPKAIPKKKSTPKKSE